MANKTAKSQEKKDQLLALAKSGVKRPGMVDVLGKALNNYCSKASHSYDEEFANEIKLVATGWFRQHKEKKEI